MSNEHRRDPLEYVDITDDTQYRFPCPNCGCLIKADKLSGRCGKCGKKIDIEPSQKEKLDRRINVDTSEAGFRGAAQHAPGD